MPATAHLKIGIEPLEVDLVIGPTVLTVADCQEIDAFFRERRILNSQSPAIRAIRKQLAAKMTAAQKAAASSSISGFTGIKPNSYAAVIAASRHGPAHKAAPAAKRAAAPAAKKAAVGKKKK